MVSFGAPLAIGESCTRTVKVVNHSPISLPLSVSILPSSSVPALQQEGVLTVSPTGDVTIKPNGGDFPISVTFSPKVRVPQFSEEVGRTCVTLTLAMAVVSSTHVLYCVLNSPGDTGVCGYLSSLVHGDRVVPWAGGHTGQQPCAIWGRGTEQPEYQKDSHDQRRGDWDWVRRREGGKEVCVEGTYILNSLIIYSLQFPLGEGTICP